MAAASVSASSMKRGVLDWVKLINSEERYYFVKAMDIFYEMPENHQRGLLGFLAHEIDMNKWLDKLEDSTQYPDVIRSVLFYFSGRKEAGQPCKNDLKLKLGEYLKSTDFETSEEDEEIYGFTDALEEL